VLLLLLLPPPLPPLLLLQQQGYCLAVVCLAPLLCALWAQPEALCRPCGLQV
jgi:hypothetical protein